MLHVLEDSGFLDLTELNGDLEEVGSSLAEESALSFIWCAVTVALAVNLAGGSFYARSGSGQEGAAV